MSYSAEIIFSVSAWAHTLYRPYARHTAVISKISLETIKLQQVTTLRDKTHKRLHLKQTNWLLFSFCDSAAYASLLYTTFTTSITQFS